MYIQGLYNVCFLPYDFYYGTEHCLHMQEKEIKTSDDTQVFSNRGLIVMEKTVELISIQWNMKMWQSFRIPKIFLVGS